MLFNLEALMHRTNVSHTCSSLVLVRPQQLGEEPCETRSVMFGIRSHR